MHLQAMFIMYFSIYKYLSKFIILLGFFLSFSWNKLVRCTRLNPTINNVYDDDDDKLATWHLHITLLSLPLNEPSPRISPLLSNIENK